MTMTTPKAIKGIEMLADALGDKAIVGVGTIIDPATCRDAISAGAQFVVSPTFDPAIVETTKRYGKISVSGVFTPNRILTAFVRRRGCRPSASLHHARPRLHQRPARPPATIETDSHRRGRFEKRRRMDQGRRGVCGVGSKKVTKDAMAKERLAGDYAVGEGVCGGDSERARAQKCRIQSILMMNAKCHFLHIFITCILHSAFCIFRAFFTLQSSSNFNKKPQIHQHPCVNNSPARTHQIANPKCSHRPQ